MAYHSVKSNIYHLYKECHVGNNIESENYKTGTGGKRLCNICKDLRKIKEENKSKKLYLKKGR